MSNRAAVAMKYVQHRPLRSLGCLSVVIVDVLSSVRGCAVELVQQRRARRTGALGQIEECRLAACRPR
jgi:hypothetical protein